MSYKEIDIDDWKEAIVDEQTDREYNGMSPGGTAKKYGVSRRTIYNWIDSGHIELLMIIKEGHNICSIVPTASIEEFINSPLGRERMKMAKSVQVARRGKRR